MPDGLAVHTHVVAENDRVASLYLGPTLTTRLRSRLSPAAV